MPVQLNGGYKWLNQLILNHSSLGYCDLELFSFFFFICNRNVNWTKAAMANARHRRYVQQGLTCCCFLYYFGQFVSWQLAKTTCFPMKFSDGAHNTECWRNYRAHSNPLVYTWEISMGGRQRVDLINESCLFIYKHPSYCDCLGQDVCIRLSV